MRKRKFILWLLGALLLLLDPITSTFRTPSSLLSFVGWFHLFHIARMEGNITLDRSSLQKLYLLWFGLVLFFFFFFCSYFFVLTLFDFVSICFDWLSCLWAVSIMITSRHDQLYSLADIDYLLIFTGLLQIIGVSIQRSWDEPEWKKKTKLKSQVNISIRSM